MMSLSKNNLWSKRLNIGISMKCVISVFKSYEVLNHEHMPKLPETYRKKEEQTFNEPSKNSADDKNAKKIQVAFRELIPYIFLHSMYSGAHHRSYSFRLQCVPRYCQVAGVRGMSRYRSKNPGYHCRCPTVPPYFLAERFKNTLNYFHEIKEGCIVITYYICLEWYLIPYVNHFLS